MVDHCLALQPTDAAPAAPSEKLDQPLVPAQLATMLQAAASLDTPLAELPAGVKVCKALEELTLEVELGLALKAITADELEVPNRLFTNSVSAEEGPGWDIAGEAS